MANVHILSCPPFPTSVSTSLVTSTNQGSIKLQPPLNQVGLTISSPLTHTLHVHISLSLSVEDTTAQEECNVAIHTFNHPFSCVCLIYIPNPQKTPKSSLENCLNNRTRLLCFLHVSTQKGELSEKLLCLHCSKRLRVPLCSPTFFPQFWGQDARGSH